MSTIQLPALPAEFEVKPDETLSLEIAGSTLHLVKWLVAEKRQNCHSLAEAIAECVEQGFKYHKRLWDAEIARAVEKQRNANQASFERWCELNAKDARDPVTRGYMQAKYGLLDPVIAEMFTAQYQKRENEKTAAAAQNEKQKKTA